MTTYTSVKLPKELAHQINEISEKAGYRSVSDFVLAATRYELRVQASKLEQKNKS